MSRSATGPPGAGEASPGEAGQGGASGGGVSSDRPRSVGRSPSVGRPRIAIVDYGMGNLRSVEKALGHVGADAEITRDHERVRVADGVVLPGVGAFPKAMLAIRALELDALLTERRSAGTPLLGICLGMQLLFEDSSELGGATGLGFLPGRVRALEATGLKVPHMGWNAVEWSRASALTDGLPDPCPLYHVHSFAPVTAEPDDLVGTATYGAPFATAVEREPIYGVQFHPEKSGARGLSLLRNFATIASRTGAAP